jgi:hypothetical protein
VASDRDERELRQVLASSAMEGRISLAFAREPHFFAAPGVDGEFVQVIVGRDRTNGRIVGLGLRAISQRFVNGRVVPVGYLSSLRVLPEYRRQAALVARGYQFLKEQHSDQRTSYYLTTIAADNTTALETIAAGRAGLPRYEPLGNYVTVAISPQHAMRRVRPHDAVVTRVATEGDRTAIVAFLREHGPGRQFFPAYTERDLFTGSGMLQGLRPQDVVMAWRDGRIAGVLGAWDQSAFKQVVVRSYSRSLALGRPFYNWTAAWRGLPTLPRAGQCIKARYGAVGVVVDDDRDVYRQLLRAQCAEMVRRGERLLLVGLHERDTLLPLARAWAGREYITRLYVVSWADTPAPGDAIGQRTPYLELGSL